MKAENELARLQAIEDVYEIILETYHSRFCKHQRDDNDEYVYDEDGNPVYLEMENEDEFRYYPWYDAKRGMAARDMFREILQKVSEYK